MNWELPFSLFAAFLSWATAANIMRVTGTTRLRSSFTTFLALAMMVGVHILPIYMIGWKHGLGLIVVFYILSGLLNGFYVSRYTASEGWPRNFFVQTKYYPLALLLCGALLLILILVNGIK